jgi:hypothetical protein
MKTKIILLIVAVCSFSFYTVAQTDYVLNGNTNGSALKHINRLTGLATTTAGTNPGWSAYFGSTLINQGLDIVTTKDGASQDSVIKITSTGTNSDLANNARLIQRLCVSGSTALAPIGLPVGVYTLKFKARATTSNATDLVVTLRSSGNNMPAYVINGYVSGANFASKSIIFTDQAWAEYTVEFDLTRTASDFTFSKSTFVNGITANQYPVICFSLQSASGAECMIDDVSFIKKSTTGLNDVTYKENQIKYSRQGNSLLFNDVQGKVYIYDTMGKLVDILQSENNKATLNIATSGLYIIRNGNRVSKIVL